MLLSDKHIQKPRDCKDARLKVQQKDQGFVYNLWQLFQTRGVVGAVSYLITQFDKTTGKTFCSYAFFTYTLPYFTELNNLWYIRVDGKFVKVLPPHIGESLTPLALAYFITGAGWYCKSTGRISLSTDSFSPAEVKQLRSILLEKLNIESTRISNGKGKEQYFIDIPKRELPKVKSLVKAHIP
jgi:hypothetical protein